jgi:hypothetical protein
VYYRLVANSPFDKLRANGQAFPFALSREPVERSKGSFPQREMDPAAGDARKNTQTLGLCVFVYMWLNKETT